MNNDRELLQQALDALNALTKELLACRDELAERGARPETPHKQKLWDSAFNAYIGMAIPTYESIRTRLAQPEQEPEKNQDKPCVEDDGCPTEKAVLQRFWREHQAQPEKEPVTTLFGSLPVYNVATQPEPVAYLTKRKLSGTEGLLRADMVDMSSKNKETHDFIPLYTAPPQQEGCAECGKQASDGWALYCVKCSEPVREWQGLTDEEIKKLQHIIDWTAGWTYGNFSRAIEAKLKDKNT